MLKIKNVPVRNMGTQAYSILCAYGAYVSANFTSLWKSSNKVGSRNFGWEKVKVEKAPIQYYGIDDANG